MMDNKQFEDFVNRHKIRAFNLTKQESVTDGWETWDSTVVDATALRKVCEQYYKEMRSWISVDDSLPEKNVPVYFVYQGQVIHGYWGESTEYGNGYRTVTGFAGYNCGYDGDSAPFKDVTHWQYENKPEAPIDNEVN